MKFFIPLTKITSLITIISPALASAVADWSQITATTTVSAPLPQRSSAIGAYDPASNSFCAYGGSGSNTYLLDLSCYSFVSNNWISKTQSTITGRKKSGGALNPQTGLLYIHGGEGSNDAVFRDFYSLNLQTMAIQILSSAPAPRLNHRECVKWNPVINRIVLYGGDNDIVVFNDIWSYNPTGDLWTQIQPTNSLAIRSRTEHACEINPTTGVLYVHGGVSSTDTPLIVFSDLFALDFQTRTWSLINAGVDSVQRSSHSISYNSASATLNAYLGYTGLNAKTQSPDIWQYSFQAQSWTLLTTNTAIPWRSYFATGFNSQTGHYYVFGGKSSSGTINNDLWSFGEVTTQNSTSNFVSSPASSDSNDQITTQVGLPDSTTSQDEQVATSAAASETTGESLSVIMPSLNLNPKSTTSKTSSSIRIVVPSAVEASQSLMSLFGLSSNATLAIIGFGGFSLLAILICVISAIRRRRNSSKTQGYFKSQSTRTQTAVLEERSKVGLTYASGYSSTSMSSGSNGSDGYSSTEYSFTMNNAGQTTFLPNEMGLSIPGYLNFDFAQDLRLDKVIYSGAMVSVHTADIYSNKLLQNATGERKCVVKVLKINNEQGKQLFFQELSLMDYFKNHQNIAKIYGYSDNPYCLILKYYEKGSLRGWLKKKSTSRTAARTKYDVLAFGHDISCGIAALHEKGVVHLDMKPENVLLDMRPGFNRLICVIADFGISQIINAEILKVKGFQIATVKGLSLKYAAPERIQVFRGQNLQGDPFVILSWDVYAIGPILFELLAASKLY